jgi:hypothetical protein
VTTYYSSDLWTYRACVEHCCSYRGVQSAGHFLAGVVSLSSFASPQWPYQVIQFVDVSRNLKKLLFSIVTPCGLVGRYHRFGGTYCLHLEPWEKFVWRDHIHKIYCIWWSNSAIFSVDLYITQTFKFTVVWLFGSLPCSYRNGCLRPVCVCVCVCVCMRIKFIVTEVLCFVWNI